MIRLTKFLFWIVDIIAMLILGGASLQAVFYPFYGPVLARMDGQYLTTVSAVGTSLLCAATAFGAYLVLRRRASGIALISASLIMSAHDGAWVGHLVLAMIVAFTLGLPFLLALQQARQKVSCSAP